MTKGNYEPRQGSVSSKPAYWIRVGARFGYLAKGAVYALIALLAARAAWIGGSASGPRDVMWAVVEQPVGMAMLGVIAAGLGAYSTWRVMQSIVDTERRGRSVKGLCARAGYLLSGIAYAGLGVAAVRILIGASRRRHHPNDSYVRDWTETMMSAPWGRWLVAGAGCAVVAFGVAQLTKMWTGNLYDEGDLSEMSRRRHRRASWFGRTGAAARGVVFVLIGGWLIIAAWRGDSSAARGLGGALDTLAMQPYGPWLLGCAAAGLFAYGLYQFTVAGFVPASRSSRFDLAAGTGAMISDEDARTH